MQFSRMLSRVGVGGLLVMWVSILLPILSTAALSKKIKVISTDAGASLPVKDGHAEILNSSLEKYPELTLCARFLTHQFSIHSDRAQAQALISYGYFDLLGSFLARPCEQAYAGCTELYKDILSKNHNTWITGKVFGYLGKGW